ncbi:MAG: peptidase M4 family protein [Acidobacteria bacterium]|nr:peptidase M4 family protein [Acidobacteriota bacterium]
MKKILSMTALIAVALSTVGLLPTSVSAKKLAFGKGTPDELENAKQISLDVLRGRAALRPIGSVDDFQVQKVEVDELKMAHTRVRQTVGGVPVWGGEAIVHLNKDGSLQTVTDDLLTSVAVNTEPNLSPKDAIQAAISMYKGSPFLTAEPIADLWIYRAADRDHLAYRVQLRREDGSKETALPVIFVDAQTGEKVFQYNNLQNASAPVSGSSLYSGVVSLTGYQSGTSFYLEDVGRKVGTFDFRNGTTTMNRISEPDSLFDLAASRAGVDAQYGAVKTRDYFFNTFGRNGIDGSGGPAYITSVDGVTGLVSSGVHYSTRYNNAFWNGRYMTYGDGDGTTFSPLTTLDICGHEMTHGITERTAALVYSGESGALNESMSDVFGAMVERSAQGESVNTWKIGEAAYTPANGTNDALRYMDNPHLAGNSGFTLDDDPDHYSERYTGTSDNGGVHINSGIGNKAFYLVAKGGTHHLGGSMTGIGADAAAAIWYKALTTYMTSSTNFAGARTATLNAAGALYGTTGAQYNAVAQAWCMVGVGACPGTGGGGGGTGTERITNGGFETSVSPWVQSGTGALYVANGNYPQAGTGYIYFGAANSVTGTTYQQITIPAGTAPTLSFYLNVSSAETTTTTAYDKMTVEVRNSAGTLLGTLGTFSNLNKVAAAGSYSQKTFSLAAYAGQTIRVQFSSTTDSSAITTFRVDTVSVK